MPFEIGALRPMPAGVATIDGLLEPAEVDVLFGVRIAFVLIGGLGTSSGVPPDSGVEVLEARAVEVEALGGREVGGGDVAKFLDATAAV